MFSLNLRLNREGAGEFVVFAACFRGFPLASKGFAKSVARCG